MNVITLSKKKFETLEPLVLSKGVINTEGEIYDFNYRGKPKVLKRLFHQNGDRFANKLYTLEMLDTNKEYLPDCFCIPDSLVSVGGIIEGFTVPKKNGPALTTILKDTSVPIQEQLYYLKKVGEILQQMSVIRKYSPLTDIYLNDMHEANFLVNPNNRQLTVIDLDSCKIKQNQAFPSKYLTPLSLCMNDQQKYQVLEDTGMGFIEPSEQTDIYCYVIMILNYLYGKNIDGCDLEDFYEYLNYLEYIGVDKELIEAISRIVISKNNKNPVHLLDTLTNENVCRARKVVYDKVKAKTK